MEMEVAGGMNWNALFQRRVVMAYAHCRNADMVACGAEEVRRALEGASAQLGLAVANMGAARHLALRCALEGASSLFRRPEKGTLPSAPASSCSSSASPLRPLLKHPSPGPLLDLPHLDSCTLRRRRRPGGGACCLLHPVRLPDRMHKL